MHRRDSKLYTSIKEETMKTTSKKQDELQLMAQVGEIISSIDDIRARRRILFWLNAKFVDDVLEEENESANEEFDNE